VTYDYVAGFVDGEGSISIAAEKHRNKRNIAFRPMLSVSNTHRGVLDEIRDFLSTGRVHLHRRRDEKHRQSYVLHVSGPGLLTVLQELAPRLIVKRAQAEVVIEFMQRRKLLRTRRIGEKEIAMVERLRTLNARPAHKGRPIRDLSPHRAGMP